MTGTWGITGRCGTLGFSVTLGGGGVALTCVVCSGSLPKEKDRNIVILLYFTAVFLNWGSVET